MLHGVTEEAGAMPVTATRRKAEAGLRRMEGSGALVMVDARSGGHTGGDRDSGKRRIG